MIRDGVSYLSRLDYLGEVLNTPSTGYSFVYHIELLMLFAALIACGPLVRDLGMRHEAKDSFGLAEFPA
jgi:MFS transporter, BCD family, chlorophyll transporter